MERKWSIEEVIEALQQWEEMFYSESETKWLINKATDLLKKQKTTFMKDGHHIMCKSCGVYWCDRDREGDQYPQNFCPNCGKAVKWE